MENELNGIKIAYILSVCLKIYVSIAPRFTRDRALGVTEQMLAEERHNLSRDYLLERPSGSTREARQRALRP